MNVYECNGKNIFMAKDGVFQSTRRVKNDVKMAWYTTDGHSMPL